MATVVVSREDLFAVGVSVAAYPAVGRGETPGSGAPAGSAAETETVQAGGVLTFTALDAGTTYILHAGSPDRYLRVTAAAVTGSRGTVLWSSGGVPPRAVGVRFTDWIGPDDPAVNAIDGDTWTDTSS